MTSPTPSTRGRDDPRPQPGVQPRSDDLGHRLDRLKPWLEEIPAHALVQVALAIDRLALLVGELAGAPEPDQKGPDNDQ